MTKDNIPMLVNAVVYFKVSNPKDAIIEIEDYAFAVRQYTQAALRDVIGNSEMDFVLTEREEIAQSIKQIVDAETNGWGVDVESIKIQEIELPAEMKRAMAKQAEAGTPYIKREGMGAVREIRRRWPYHVVADIKTLDGGSEEGDMAHAAGASAATVVGSAPTETLDAFIARCAAPGMASMIDMLGVADPCTWSCSSGGRRTSWCCTAGGTRRAREAR